MPLDISKGGTASVTAAGARLKLGLSDLATMDPTDVTITGGTITGIALSGLDTPLAIADGGTASTTASDARTSLFGVSTTTDNAIARYDDITGALQNSSVTIDDSGNIVTSGSITGASFTGSIDANTLDGLDSTDFATAAQGALADSAIQSADLATVATTGAYIDLTGTPTASDLLTSIKTVDGTGSGLDADTLDGNDSTYFLAATTYTASDILTKIKTVDGSGSGLDADTLDGHDTSFFQTALGYTPVNAAGDTMSGGLTLTAGQFAATASNGSMELGALGSSNTPFIDFHSGATAVDYDVRFLASGGTGTTGGGILSFAGAGFRWATAPSNASDLVNKTYVDGQPLSKAYESTQQTITSAGALSLTHSLGGKPKLVIAVLQCTTAEAGYSIGDEIVIQSSNQSSSGTTRVNSFVATTTIIGVRYSQETNCFIAANKTTGADVGLTNASWKMVVRAWL